MSNWRERAGLVFETEKMPATGSNGMVVTNHPLGSAAGAEMLAAGDNAIVGWRISDSPAMAYEVCVLSGS